MDPKGSSSFLLSASCLPRKSELGVLCCFIPLQTSGATSPLPVCLHTAQLTPHFVRILPAQDSSRKEHGDVQKTPVGVCVRTQAWKILYNFDHHEGSGRKVRKVFGVVSEFLNLHFFSLKKKRNLRNVVAAILKGVKLNYSTQLSAQTV